MMTHVLVFLEQHQVLRKVLPDELLDDLLFDARVQHVGHQAGVSQHVTGATWSLDGVFFFRKLQVSRRASETTRTRNIYESTKKYLGTLRGEGFFEICQNLCAQLTLSCLYSKQDKKHNHTDVFALKQMEYLLNTDSLNENRTLNAAKERSHQHKSKLIIQFAKYTLYIIRSGMSKMSTA